MQSNHPPIVATVAEFVYHQSQFMRDQFLLNATLLEQCVRAIVPGVEGLTRNDIEGQFFAALQPPRRGQSGVIQQHKRDVEDVAEKSRISKRPKRESVLSKKAKESAETLKDARGFFKRPPGRAPSGKSWDNKKGGWVDSSNEQKSQEKSRPKTQGHPKGPHPLPSGWRKKGCIWDYSIGRWIPNPTTLDVSPSVPPKEKKTTSDTPGKYAIHNWKQPFLKKDERGLFKQPNGRPPRNCYWDRKVGKWREFPFA